MAKSSCNLTVGKSGTSPLFHTPTDTQGISVQDRKLSFGLLLSGTAETQGPRKNESAWATCPSTPAGNHRPLVPPDPTVIPSLYTRQINRDFPGGSHSLEEHHLSMLWLGRMQTPCSSRQGQIFLKAQKYNVNNSFWSGCPLVPLDDGWLAPDSILHTLAHQGSLRAFAS